jgi:hypothetical protein
MAGMNLDLPGRLLLGVTLILVGVAGYVRIFASPSYPDLSFWLTTIVWIGSGAAIGTGILLPFKWSWLWVAGATTGASMAFAVLALLWLLSV